MRTWTTEVWLAGMPDDVLELLTDPEAIAEWSPVPFELLELDSARLEPGAHARVRGSLASRSVEFDVDIRDARDGRLSLLANGPISIDAEYVLRPADGGSELQASVSVSGRGLLGSMMARAVEAMLAAGALRASVGRLGRQLEPALA